MKTNRRRFIRIAGVTVTGMMAADMTGMSPSKKLSNRILLPTQKKSLKRNINSFLICAVILLPGLKLYVLDL